MTRRREAVQADCKVAIAEAVAKEEAAKEIKFISNRGGKRFFTNKSRKNKKKRKTRRV
jgi:hypothetical protein